MLVLVTFTIGCTEKQAPVTASSDTTSSSNPVTTITTIKTASPTQAPTQAMQDDFSEVTHLSVLTMKDNWDPDADDDGISVYVSLKDNSDNIVDFYNSNLPVDIKIYTTKFDSNFKEYRDRLVYSGSATIHSSREMNMFLGNGIRISFDDMNVPSGENYGWTYATVHTPEGESYEGVDKFTGLTP